MFTAIIIVCAVLIILTVAAVGYVCAAAAREHDALTIQYNEVMDHKYFDDDYNGPYFESDDTYTLWYSFDGDASKFIVTKSLPTRGFYWIHPAGIKAWHLVSRNEQPFRISYADLTKNYRPEEAYGHDKFAMPQK